MPLIHDVCIEYAHAYLNELGGEYPDPDLSVVEDAYDAASNPVSVVIVDDTGRAPDLSETDETFVEYRNRVAAEYVQSLEMRPDVLCFESEFTPAIDWFMYQLPLVSPNQLNGHAEVVSYYSESDDGLYFYAADDGGLRRVRVTDYRPSAKNVGYTCGAYDAAMTLAKLDVVPSPDDRMAAEEVLTFHNSRYIDSSPHHVSREIRSFLRRAGVVEYDTERVAVRPLEPVEQSA